MAKHKRQKRNPDRPSKALPFNQRDKILVAQADEAERQAARMRRFLWLAVKKAGGRVEITEEEYREAMQAEASKTCVGITNEPGKTVTLFLADETGEPLPESDPKRIILTDDPNPNRK